MDPNKKLKWIYADIAGGYSKFSGDILKHFYIRHIDSTISADLEVAQEHFREEAKRRGLITMEARLAQVNEEGSWTTKDECSLSDQNAFIRGLKKTKSKKFLLAEIKNLNDLIDSETTKLDGMEMKRREALGPVIETYVNKRISEYYMFVSTFKDPKLTERYFSEMEFEDLEDEEVADLITTYNKFSEHINTKNIKRVAISNFFLNFFYLCEDNPFTFFGKPIIHLTYNQIELFGQGRYFKSIFQETKGEIPFECEGDPDKLIEWYDANKNVEKLMGESQDDKAVSLVGATKEDMKRLGLETGSKVIDFGVEAAKHGGKLDMEQMMKLQFGQ